MSVLHEGQEPSRVTPDAPEEGNPYKIPEDEWNAMTGEEKDVARAMYEDPAWSLGWAKAAKEAEELSRRAAVGYWDADLSDELRPWIKALSRRYPHPEMFVNNCDWRNYNEVAQFIHDKAMAYLAAAKEQGRNNVEVKAKWSNAAARRVEEAEDAGLFL